MLLYGLIGTLTSKLNCKTVPVLPSLNPSLIFPFHLLPSRCTLTDFASPPSQTSLPFSSSCHKTTSTLNVYLCLFQ